MNPSKYIVGEINTGIGTFLGAIVFSNFVPHSQFKDYFTEILGAGFFYVDHHLNVVVYDRSVSLGVVSRPEDAKIISKALNLLD